MIDLKKFCGEANRKYDFTKPFVIDGYKYATDGRIGVRVKCDEPDTEEVLPKIKHLFDKDKLEYLPGRPIFKPSNLEKVRCSECSSGKVGIYAECDTCGGSGEHYCLQCDASHGCGVCFGDGQKLIRREPCTLCDKDNQIFEDIVVDGYKLKGVYVTKLLNQVSQIAAVATGGVQVGGVPIVFEFDGGEAIIMPYGEREEIKCK